MSVNIHVSCTKLPNVMGRLNYMTSPEKQQEKLIAVAGNLDKKFWKRLAKCNRENFTPRERKIRRKDGSVVVQTDQCCEGRELMVILPNNFLELSEIERQNTLDHLVRFVSERTGTECGIALHDSHAVEKNEKEGNTHVHILVAERIELDEPEIKIADRNQFYDEEGKRRYKKSEILDEDGNVRPGCRIVAKGEIVSEKYFSEKLPEFKSREWIAEMKEELAGWINRELKPDQERVVYDPYGPYLAQRHIKKGTPKKKEADIKRWNDNVKRFNKLVRDGVITEEEAVDYKTRIALSPYQGVELDTILSDLYMPYKEMDNQKRKSYEDFISQYAGYGRRTAESDIEAAKKKLRALYRQRTLVKQAERNATNSFDKQLKRSEGSFISIEIDRLKYELGYADGPSIYGRRQAVKDIADGVRDSHAARTEARKEAYDDKTYAGKKVSRAYEELKVLRGWTEYRGDGSKVHHAGICKKMNDPRIKAAEEKLDEARWAYQEEKEKVKMHKLAVKVEHEYKTLAMRLAADPTVPQEDVDRAALRYEKAAQLLQEPTSSTVKSLHHELKALQRSQRLREEKRRAELENKTKKGETVGNLGGNH